MVGAAVRRRAGRVRGACLPLAFVALALVTACTGNANASWRSGPAAASSSPSAPAAALTITPATGAADVSVREPVVVDAQGATLDSVTVSYPGGKAVDGKLDEARHTWTSTDPLAYGKSYTVTVTATSVKGEQVTQTSAFATIKPAKTTTPYLRASSSHLLSNGGAYGVGQPITLYFDRAVTDRAAAEGAVEVVTDPPTVGGWHWFDKQEVHWRPQEYWKPGTKVTVKAKMYGVKLGDGLYGQADRTVSFTIGPSRIAIADSNTHHMLVYIDGQLVRDIPISMGKGGIIQGSKGETVNFWTNSGPHVAIEKDPNVRMTSASYGVTDPKNPNFYDENVRLAVRITYSGEFAHMADWNIPDQGKRNTSHGCVNIGPANAQWFYDTFGPGDIVDVRNTPRKLDPRNGLGDWMIPWAQWDN
jgi:lipoprotein-anchoring transpeptidase ErfK/SrfK